MPKNSGFEIFDVLSKNGYVEIVPTSDIVLVKSTNGELARGAVREVFEGRMMSTGAADAKQASVTYIMRLENLPQTNLTLYVKLQAKYDIQVCLVKCILQGFSIVKDEPLSGFSLIQENRTAVLAIELNPRDDLDNLVGINVMSAYCSPQEPAATSFLVDKIEIIWLSKNDLVGRVNLLEQWILEPIVLRTDRSNIGSAC